METMTTTTDTKLTKWDTEYEEVEKLGNRNWFKPEPDIEYLVTFLDEGSEPVEKTFDDRTITQVDFLVRAEDEEGSVAELTWTLTKGGKDSAYGRIVKIFKEKGFAAGVSVLVTAIGEGKNRRYHIKTPRGSLQ